MVATSEDGFANGSKNLKIAANDFYRLSAAAPLHPFGRGSGLHLSLRERSDRKIRVRGFGLSGNRSPPFTLASLDLSPPGRGRTSALRASGLARTGMTGASRYFVAAS